MSSVGSVGSNMMRITGMATGLDTDSMVKAMTATYQYKIDKVNQDKQIMQWRQEEYRDIIKDIKGLQEYFNVTSDKYILSESKFNPIKVTNSDEDVIGFTATSSAQQGTYKINVSKLAQPAIVKGGEISAANGTATKLTNLGFTENNEIKFNINGAEASITVTESTTIKNVLDAINNDTDIKSKGITASFDELSKKFVFKTNNTGLGSDGNPQAITVAVSGDTSNNLKLNSTDLQSTSSENAEFTITYPDGRSETVKNQKNNIFTANGITYNLKTAGNTTITVEKNNTDNVFKNIEGFISDYNSTIEKIEGKLSEKKQYDYKPLTDEQKEAMSDDDIKKWEEKAKQGILRNDNYLESLMGELRGVLFDTVYSSKLEGTKNTYHMGIYGAGALGLDTSKEITERGKIIIKDEDKLKKAISDNIDQFTKFFIGQSSTELPEKTNYIGSNTYYEDGLFTRIDKIMRNYAGDPGVGKDGTSTVKGTLNVYVNKQYDFSMTGMASKNTIPDQIYIKSLSIEKLQEQLSAAEERYYAQFASLETAMNQMNAQLSSFYSQMGMKE